MRAIVISSLLLSFALAFSACDRLDTREATYKDYKAAEDAGEVTRGWIPIYIPKSAVEIHIKSDVETNGTWMTFRARIDDLSSILNSCQLVSQADVNYPRRSPARWWPASLVANATQQITGYEYYRCEDKGTIALDKKKGEFFFWQ